MSFVMLYQLPRSQTNRCFILTGVVGKDNQLYWMMSDVLRLAPMNVGPLLSTVRVRDVIGQVGEKRFRRKRVLTHLQACKVLRRASRKEVRRFVKQLNSPRTWVHEVARSDPAAPWKEPSVLRMLANEEKVEMQKHDLFFAWYACFRQRVAEVVYGSANVRALCGEKEEREDPVVFPCSILLKHGDQSVRYVREPE